MRDPEYRTSTKGAFFEYFHQGGQLAQYGFGTRHRQGDGGDARWPYLGGIDAWQRLDLSDGAADPRGIPAGSRVIKHSARHPPKPCAIKPTEDPPRCAPPPIARGAGRPSLPCTPMAPRRL